MISRKLILACEFLQYIDVNPGTCLADYAETAGVSVSYLEQIASRLVKAGMIHGKRGPGGGYTLMPGFVDVVDVSSALNLKAGGGEMARECYTALSRVFVVEKDDD